MSRIDKALEKAGLVPESDKKTSGAADEEELISAWDLDLSKDPEPAEDVLRSRAERNGTDVATRQAEPETYVDDTGIHARTDSTPYAGQSETTAWVTEASPLGEGQRSATDELQRVDSESDFPGLPLAINRSFEDKLVAMPSMEAQSVEQFRRLAAMLHPMQGNNKLKTVLITSALPSEGKTLTASNLALCLSGSYRRSVLLIDGDLRRPTVHELFEVPGATGLTEWLRQTGPEGPEFHRVSKNLSILPAGKPDTDPMGVLTSERMHELVVHASEKVDWVILDSPPVGLLSDGHLLSAMADAAVLVVRAAHTPYADIQKAIEALGREKIAGVVLNQAEQTKISGHYGYDTYEYAKKEAEEVV